ncbi:MAG TPA: hypothetical protein VGM05_06325 [Planctomycetaceae bacterium]
MGTRGQMQGCRCGSPIAQLAFIHEFTRDAIETTIDWVTVADDLLDNVHKSSPRRPKEDPSRQDAILRHAIAKQRPDPHGFGFFSGTRLQNLVVPPHRFDDQRAAGFISDLEWRPGTSQSKHAHQDPAIECSVALPGNVARHLSRLQQTGDHRETWIIGRWNARDGRSSELFQCDEQRRLPVEESIWRKAGLQHGTHVVRIP